MATGIKDKVVILGMGCSKFGERWDCNAQDLMVEAFEEALADAGIERKQIEAAWLGTAIEEQHLGKSAVPLAMTLRLPYIPVTRVENYCATGTEALRGAVYAVASGAADIALALGVEKLKDTGYGGLPQRGRGALNDLFWPNLSAPGSFAQLAAAYRAKHGADKGDLKRAMAHISVKSHANAGKNPKAHLRNPITMDDVMNASMIAEPLGLYDCCGVSDGSACAIVTTPDIARGLGKKRPGGGEGAAGGRVQRRGGAVRPVGRLLLRHHPRRRGACLQGGRHHQAARAGVAGRRARLLLGDRAGDDGRPAAVAPKARPSATCSTASSMPTAPCRARSTAGSSASATRSAHRACAWSTRCTCNCRAAPAHASARRRPGA